MNRAAPRARMQQLRRQVGPLTTGSNWLGGGRRENLCGAAAGGNGSGQRLPLGIDAMIPFPTRVPKARTTNPTQNWTRWSRRAPNKMDDGSTATRPNFHPPLFAGATPPLDHLYLH